MFDATIIGFTVWLVTATIVGFLLWVCETRRAYTWPALGRALVAHPSHLPCARWLR
jgi:hypothetical protein